MSDEDLYEDREEKSGDRMRIFRKTAMPVTSLILLAVGIMLWVFQVRVGLTLLEEGARGMTGGRVEFNAFYAASWIWLSLVTFLTLLACREHPRRSAVINIVIYVVLLGSLILRIARG